MGGGSIANGRQSLLHGWIFFDFFLLYPSDLFDILAREHGLLERPSPFSGMGSIVLGEHEQLAHNIGGGHALSSLEHLKAALAREERTHVGAV